MHQHHFDINTVWCIHSPRSGEYWLVRCPSKSGAKIFLCGPHGPQVPTSKGPFEAWEYNPAEIPENVPVLQATFFRADDPRNWKPETELAQEKPSVSDQRGTEGTEPPIGQGGG